MASRDIVDATVVPVGSETDAERARIRRSNDRDQHLEREGKRSTHNQGYDEAADHGPTAPEPRAAPPLARSTMPGDEVHDDWESAANAGDETPGGDNPTPDDNVVDDIGRAIGVNYQPDEPLRSADKIEDRDRSRWKE